LLSPNFFIFLKRDTLILPLFLCGSEIQEQQARTLFAKGGPCLFTLRLFPPSAFPPMDTSLPILADKPCTGVDTLTYRLRYIECYFFLFLLGLTPVRHSVQRCRRIFGEPFSVFKAPDTSLFGRFPFIFFLPPVRNRPVLRFTMCSGLLPLLFDYVRFINSPPQVLY